MLRYHLNLHNCVGFVPDEEGREPAGPDEARSEALKGARSTIAEEVLQGRVDLRGRLEVVDRAGKVLMTIAFSEAVEMLR